MQLDIPPTCVRGVSDLLTVAALFSLGLTDGPHTVVGRPATRPPTHFHDALEILGRALTLWSGAVEVSLRGGWGLTSNEHRPLCLPFTLDGPAASLPPLFC